MDHGNPVAKDSGGVFCFFVFFFFFILNEKKPKDICTLCTLYTSRNKSTTFARGSAEQLPQDLGGTVLNLPRLGRSGRIG